MSKSDEHDTGNLPVIDEAKRAIAMADFGLTDWSGDDRFNSVAHFAARLCDAPIALVSLVEVERQRFLGKVGLAEDQNPRSVSFCDHAMRHPEPMIVPDATLDPRFGDNALVTGYPHIRFYAGSPLITSDGVPLGALCVIDTVPRNGLTPLQAEGLKVLAANVMAVIDVRREAEQCHLMARELDHRIKNLFALFSGLVHFIDDHSEPGVAKRELANRIAALARAHQLIGRTDNGGDQQPVGIRDLLEALLEPYRSRTGSRLRIVGDDIILSPDQVTPTALVFHELATNAAKYGALSTVHGHIDIAIDHHDDKTVSIIWSEQGGPPVSDPGENGFGTKLIDVSARRQLRAALTREWRPEGLRFTMTIGRDDAN